LAGQKIPVDDKRRELFDRDKLKAAMFGTLATVAARWSRVRANGLNIISCCVIIRQARDQCRADWLVIEKR